MTNSPQPKATSTPAVLVYGKPASPDLPQASWFRAEDRPTVAAAAQGLKFALLDILTEAERTLTVGVHEGVLKGNGRMILGSVTPEVYRRIEEHAAKASPALAAASVSTGAAVAKSATDQNKNIFDLPAPPASPVDSKPASAVSPTRVAAAAGIREAATAANPWETLKVGARVLAAYWNEDREFEGFWLATVKKVEKGEFTLEWFESPEYPPFKSRPKNIAVPHPEFRPSGK